MKKLMFILLMLFSIKLYAQEGLHGFFELGKAENPNVTDFAEKYYPVYYTQINLNYRFDIWRFENSICGGVLMYFICDPGISFNGYPFKDVYTVGYKLKYSHFYFKLEHFCVHAVQSKTIHQGNGNTMNQEWWNNQSGSTMTKFAFGIEF